MKETSKLSIKSNVLVGVGKSSRLAAMKDKMKASGDNQQPCGIHLKSGVTDVLQQARDTVDNTINVIFNAYPAGKKNAFFKLKYGHDRDKIKKLSMRKLFAILKLETKLIHRFKLIESLDFNGNVVDD